MYFMTDQKRMQPGTGQDDPVRVEWRKQRAEARKRAAGNRSDFAQLRLLHDRGHGHCKEAKKLAKSILADNSQNGKAVELARETLS